MDLVDQDPDLDPDPQLWLAAFLKTERNAVVSGECLPPDSRQCQPGMYNSGGTCLACHNSCKTCTGPKVKYFLFQTVQQTHHDIEKWFSLQYTEVLV
jgi:hypothetical protein